MTDKMACPQCNSAISAEDKYCMRCGAELPELPASFPPASNKPNGSAIAVDASHGGHVQIGDNHTTTIIGAGATYIKNQHNLGAAPRPPVCAQCGVRLEPDQRFCPNCGARV